jgi:HD-like signal output (HDOD) protein
MELKRAITQAHDEQRPLFECEKQIIGATHAEIGAYLLGLWGLPYPIVEAVAMHHTAGSIASHGFDLLATLAISLDLLDASIAGELHDGATAARVVDPSYFAGLNAPFGLLEAQRRVAFSVSPESVS